MKRRILAIFMIAAMILTMVPIIALAENLPSVTPVSDKVYLIEGTSCCQDAVWVDDHDEYWTHYTFQNVRFDVEGVEYEVWMDSIFTSDETDYILRAKDTQAYEDQWEINDTGYNVSIDLCDPNTGDPIKENIAEITVYIVEKPDVTVDFESDVDLYADIDTNKECDWLCDSETGDWYFSPEYDKFNYWIPFTFEYNGETNYQFEYLGTTYNAEIRFDEGVGETYENRWQEGESYVGNVYFMDQFCGQITYHIHGDFIKEFTIEDIKMIKDVDNKNHFFTDENGNEFNYYPLDLASLNAHLELTDGRKYDTQIMCSSLQENIVINGYVQTYVDIDLCQTYENQWDEAGTYEVTATYLGRSTTFNVELIDTPIDSVDFDDVSIYEYTNGYPTMEGTFIYSPSITMSNLEIDDPLYLDGNEYGINYSGKWCEPEIESNQSDESPWEAGNTYNVKANILGYSGDVNISLLKADVIDDMAVTMNKVYVTENTNGINSEEGFIYRVAPDFVVNYSDGSVGFSPNGNEFSGAGVDIERAFGYYYEKTIDDYFVYSFRDAEGFEQTPDNLWEAGNTYKMKMYFLGKEYEYEVEILPSEVESIEILDTPVVTLNEWGNCWIDPNPIRINIVYKNGNEVVKTLGEIIGNDYASSGLLEWSDYENGTYNVSYLGVKDSVKVKLLDNYPIKSLTIDEDTIGKAYKVDGKYYFSASDFDVNVEFTDGSTTTVHMGNMGWPTTVEKDGCSMYVNTEWVEVNEQWFNDGHTFRVYSNDVYSNPVVVNIIENPTVEVELISKQDFMYVKNDALFSDCMSGTFDPFDFRGMKIKCTINGEEHMLYGDDMFHEQYFVFQNVGSSNGIDFEIAPESDGWTSHIMANILGKKYHLYDIEAVESPITNIEVLNAEEMQDKLDNQIAEGLKFKVSYNDGSSKVMTLGQAEGGWIGISMTGKGDGGIMPVDSRGVSGIRFDWYNFGNEYVSIIWNNNLLRFYDQILFLDTGKTMNLNSNLAEGTVEVSSDTIMNDVIDQLSLENRYKVEQQGMDINTEISVNSTDASKDILKLAKKDDATIEAAYAIDLAYILDGETLELTELGDGKVAVKIKLPDELVGKDNIVVYREHTNPDGSVTVEEIQGVLSEDGKYVTFESSKFSTFALGYKDKKDVPPGGNGGTNNEKPILPETVEKIANTLDNSPIGGTIVLMMSSGLCAYAVIKKRREIA